MNWDALGAIAELLGAISVIATLAYLSVQIKQNTRSQKSAIAQATTASRTSWYELGASDPEFTLLWTKGHARPETLSDEERTRFIWMMARIFSTFEETFAQFQLGMFPEEDWSRYRTTARTMLENPLISEWWASGTTVFTIPFVRDLTPDLDVSRWTQDSMVAVTEKQEGSIS